MANQRQRLARKCFREANPDLCPPKPTPPADGTKKKSKKNKKSMFKKAKKGGGSGRSKHPLRVPGMRPGERCFICKSTDHVAKACPEKALWDKNKICLLCRERGHSLKNCPEKSEGNLKKFCYNCGESGHSLSKCPKPIENGGTKFASCFVCKQQGHLSKNCPENKHGIYPKVVLVHNSDIPKSLDQLIIEFHVPLTSSQVYPPGGRAQAYLMKLMF